MNQRYRQLVEEFPLRPIRSDRQLERACGIAFGLAKMNKLNRAEQDYLGVLSDLIERYEEESHPVPGDTSGVEALRFLIEENGLSLSKLAAQTGIQVSSLSEILRGKRRLSLKHVQRLAARFRVDPGLFIPTTDPAKQFV